MSYAGEVVTDSAGVTCRYTPIVDIQPGDVVVEGWRSTVASRESDGESDGLLYSLTWEGGGRTPWLAPSALLPVEVHEITRYFTFGEAHCHRINGFTWDADVVCKITAVNPRDVAMRTFGLRWSFEYETEDDVKLSFYRRGIKELVT